MPGLLAGNDSRQDGLLLDKEGSFEERSRMSSTSPRVSFSGLNGIGLDVAVGSPSPDNGVEDARNSDASNEDPAGHSANQVLPDSACISSNGNGTAHEQDASIEECMSISGSEAGLHEQPIISIVDTEAKFYASSPSAQDSKMAQHSYEGNVVQVSSTSAKNNMRKKPALSPRLYAKPKELDKEITPLPKSAGRARESGKERVPSPKMPSPTASALKARDYTKGKVESINLSSVAVIKETEKEKSTLLEGEVSPVTKEAEKEKRSPREGEVSPAHDPSRVKGKTKPLPLAAAGKRPSPLSMKPIENPSPLENAKHMATSKDQERASPNSPSSPPRSNAKATPVSPLRPLRITPPSLSERPPFTTSKMSPRKPASRPMGPDSPATATKGAEKKLSSDNVLLDYNQVPYEGGEKTNQKVNSLLQRKKSGAISRKLGDNDSITSSDQANNLARENPNMGPFLLKLARQAIMSGDNPHKALDYASRAAKSYESAADGKPSLDLAMSLHILAATHCILGQFEAAIPVLQQSIGVTDIEGGGQDHALAAFAGNMQLGDTYSLLGRGDDALGAYHVGLEVQKSALGEMDLRVGETCRYLAEAHTQAMQFDKAEELCQHALNIHKEHSAPASIEESTDRRLMGLICNGKGDHEVALEHLVLASMALIANGKDVDVASVDTSIGDTYASLGRFDEAVFSYQKALTVFKASKGENHVAVASVYVSLAELYLKTGKSRECRTYCDSALRIYNKQDVGSLDEVASGLTELAVVYEALNEQEQALSLLKKALGILDTAPGQQSSIAGVEAQIGVLSYMCGNYVDARSSLSKAVTKLRGSAEKTSALFGIVLNQMGLCCLQLTEIKMAVQLFEESRSVLETACGPYHPDTLTVYSNLAGAYDALGRLDEAIIALQYVVEVREEELGTANSDVEDERRRLTELLREAGRLRARRLNNTLGLLMHPKTKRFALAMSGHSVTSAAVVSVNG